MKKWKMCEFQVHFHLFWSTLSQFCRKKYLQTNRHTDKIFLLLMQINKIFVFSKFFYNEKKFNTRLSNAAPPEALWRFSWCPSEDFLLLAFFKSKIIFLNALFKIFDICLRYFRTNAWKFKIYFEKLITC